MYKFCINFHTGPQSLHLTYQKLDKLVSSDIFDDVFVGVKGLLNVDSKSVFIQKPLGIAIYEL